MIIRPIIIGIAFLYVICCQPFALMGNEYGNHSLIQIDRTDGLSCSKVFCAFQDGLGYIWFGTEYGVTRFDGQEYENYSLREGLGDHAVINIEEDSRGIIWFLSAAGKLACFYNETFYNQENSRILKEASGNTYLYSMYETEEKNLWFCTDKNGAVCIEVDGTVRRAPKLSKIKEGGHPRLIYENASQDLIWVDLWGVFDGNQSEQGYSYKFASEEVRVTGRYTKVREGTYLMSTFENDIVILENERARSWYKPVKNPISELIVALEYLPDGTLWAGTLDGAYYFREGKLLGKILAGYSVSDILPDSEGNLWFTTHNNGVFLMPALNFRDLSLDKVKAFQQISAAFVDEDGAYYLGGIDNSLKRIDQAGNLVENIITGTPNAERGITKILRYNEETILAGTKAGLMIQKRGIARFFPIGGIKDMLLLPGNRLAMVSGRRLCMFSEPDLDSLWDHWQSPQGLLSIQENTGTLLGYTKAEGRFYGLYQLQDGALLLSKADELVKYDNGILVETEGDLAKIKSRLVDLIYENDSVFWLATRGQGVFRFENGQASTFNESSRLLSNNCTSILRDQKGNIWVGTVAGLNLIPHGNNGSIRSFTEYNGLPTNEITSLIGVGDSIVIGTQRGLCWIDLNELEAFLVPPRFFISGIEVDGSELAIQPNLILQEPRNIRLKFKGIAFRHQASLQYRFRFTPSWPNWQNSQNNFVRLAAPSPGEHLFEAQASLDGLRWSPSNSIWIKVQKRPGQTLIWWFAVGAFVFLILLGIMIRRRRHKASQKNSFVRFRTEGKNYNLPISEVLFLRASGDYVEVITPGKTYLVRTTLKKMEAEVKEFPLFHRVHRSYIVNLEHVKAHDTKELLIVDHRIPISKTYQIEIRDRLQPPRD